MTTTRKKRSTAKGKTRKTTKKKTTAKRKTTKRKSTAMDGVRGKRTGIKKVIKTLKSNLAELEKKVG